MRWEQSEKGTWWLVEHDGQMRTGPFETKEKGREFFRKEFEIELGEEDEHGNISSKG